MTWTTELANAETAENASRAVAKGSQNSYFRIDARATVLLNDWIRARAAASSAGVPASDARYWGNVAARAVTAMGPSWAVVTALPLSNLFGETGQWNYEMASHMPFGFVQLDGLFGGLVTDWARNVWTTSGRTVPAAAYPPQETWSYIFAQSITNAGPT